MPRISLRKVRATDKNYFARWWRDRDLLRLTSGILTFIPDEDVEKYFSVMINNPSNYYFMITVGKKVIGHISLVRRGNDWYETQIIIGERENWNKGYGTKAIQLLIRRTRHLGISKIYLEVRPDNVRAIKAYEKCGFIKARVKKYPKNDYLPETLKMKFVPILGEERKAYTNSLM